MIFQRFFLDTSCLASNWFRIKIAIATEVFHNVHGSNDITKRGGLAKHIELMKIWVLDHFPGATKRT